MHTRVGNLRVYDIVVRVIMQVNLLRYALGYTISGSKYMVILEKRKNGISRYICIASVIII